MGGGVAGTGDRTGELKAPTLIVIGKAYANRIQAGVYANQIAAAMRSLAWSLRYEKKRAGSEAVQKPPPKTRATPCAARRCRATA